MNFKKMMKFIHCIILINRFAKLDRVDTLVVIKNYWAI